MSKSSIFITSLDAVYASIEKIAHKHGLDAIELTYDFISGCDEVAVVKGLSAQHSIDISGDESLMIINHAIHSARSIHRGEGYIPFDAYLITNKVVERYTLIRDTVYSHLKFLGDVEYKDYVEYLINYCVKRIDGPFSINFITEILMSAAFDEYCSKYIIDEYPYKELVDFSYSKFEELRNHIGDKHKTIKYQNKLKVFIGNMVSRMAAKAGNLQYVIDEAAYNFYFSNKEQVHRIMASYIGHMVSDFKVFMDKKGDKEYSEIKHVQEFGYVFRTSGFDSYRNYLIALKNDGNRTNT